MTGSQIKQNFPQECEDGINKQINTELYAHYVYLSMSYYFDRDDVALPGFCEHFKRNSSDEQGHAEKLMKFQNSRGGKIILQDIKKPDKDDWSSSFEALQSALSLEKKVNQDLLDLRGVAEKLGDFQTSDFLDEMLKEQIEEIKCLADMITNIKRAGVGLGEYMFDQQLKKDYDSNK